MTELQSSLEGVVPFLMYFVPAIIIVFGFMWIYTKITRFDEATLIKENNSAAAVIFVGTMFGYALPIASTIANSAGLIDFAVWAVIACVAQLVTYQLFLKFYPKLEERVMKGEMAASTQLAGISVVVGLINAASIIY